MEEVLHTIERHVIKMKVLDKSDKVLECFHESYFEISYSKKSRTLAEIVDILDFISFQCVSG